MGVFISRQKTGVSIAGAAVRAAARDLIWHRFPVEASRGFSIVGGTPDFPMPIYEYYSPDNNKLYQFLVRNPALRDKTPRCPDDAAFRMERRVSRFAIVGKAREDKGDDPFADIDDAKMEALMADMERDMGGMDEDNPDPRQLGHFMRKITDLMGDKTPPELREIVKRLEAGEDPDKLEEQFGDLAGDEEGAADALFAQALKKARASRQQPVRDPKLYELADYLEQRQE